ncbi:MAG: putative DNA-binding domain-containing protein [Rhodospirillales bacterium]|nr:putative DNA-binding domain-containing protein [Rhodospirillales bacterium]
MSALLELQRRFGATLLAVDAAPPPEVLGGCVAPAARVGIYRNNVIGNLTGVLRLTYPAIERLVGADFFAAAAARFIVAAPPAGADLYEYGGDFSDFLTEFEPANGLAYLPDVARLEWAVNRALHAPVAPTLAAEALLDVPAEQQADVRFVAHPSLSLLALTHPARTIWEAVLTEDADVRATRLAAIDLAAPGEHLAVLGGNDAPQVLRLSPAAFGLARALGDGQSLAEALDPVAPEKAASLLSLLLTQGFFGEVRAAVDQHPPERQEG